MASEKVTAFVEELKNLTVIELSELVSAIAALVSVNWQISLSSRFGF